MKTFAVFTHFVEGVAEKRAPFREAHLANLRDLHAKGTLLIGGALVNPLDAGLLIIRAESPEEIEKLLSTDPYQVNGIWKRIECREWNVVVGNVAPAA
jgi:uncharacterized protein YciI